MGFVQEMKKSLTSGNINKCLVALDKAKLSLYCKTRSLGAGEMVRWVKCSLCKPTSLSSDPQNSLKRLGGVLQTCNPSPGGVGRDRQMLGTQASQSS